MKDLELREVIPKYSGGRQVITVVLVRGMQEGQSQKGGYVTVEAETGMMQGEAKECWHLVNAGRVKEWILPWSLQKEVALPTPSS